ncbi:TetR/AcrR family transcriptional regulator [Pectobacterium jejuense]|uniref:TetR/AcrR family transcriptional regulator n=1 Tax=Pectobacterium jejuense TaxID=2974022 RepID=UPI002282576C|nr:TetR family transcriptional regulator [Pectobacterium jejuense]MCY9848581.1 TetR family transcriptional regulator [Pectobacterium jejuense]
MSNENQPEGIKATARRKRRYEPARRERIIAVTLDIIEHYGVAGTSWRKIAEAADVSLGSLTYYFESTEHLLEEAFRLLATEISAQFYARLARAQTQEDALIAVVDIIDQKVWGSPRTLLLSFELYAFASRNPRLKYLPQLWMEQSRSALEQHFSASAARALDVLIEGIGTHNFMDQNPMGRNDIERLVRLVARE